jgi:hypothetical protein
MLSPPCTSYLSSPSSSQSASLIRTKMPGRLETSAPTWGWRTFVYIHSPIYHEHILPTALHDVVTEVANQEPHVYGLALILGRNRQGMFSSLCEKQFQSSAFRNVEPVATIHKGANLRELDHDRQSVFFRGAHLSNRGSATYKVDGSLNHFAFGNLERVGSESRDSVWAGKKIMAESESKCN